MTASEAVRDFLDSRELEYGIGGKCEQSETTFLLRSRGNTCGMLIRVAASDSQSALRVHVFGSARASVHAFTEAQKLLRWSNSDDPFGMFVIHTTNGEVCYTAAVKRVRGEITAAAVGRIVELAAARYDRLYPSLSRITLNFEKADDLIPVMETPTWDRLMQSMKNDLKGLVVVKPEARIPGRVLTVGHVALFIGGEHQS